MKSIWVEAFGGSDVLQQLDLPEPAAGPSEVVVEVEAAGVGFVDVVMRSGAYPGVAPGFTPGAEIAGRVVAIGEGVDGALLGRRVFAITAVGGCAERIATAAAKLHPLPDALAYDEAVATGVNALVAYFGLRRLHLTAQDRLLIRGASGSIGNLAVQIALLSGHTVVAATSSPEALRGLGPAQIVDRSLASAGEFDALFDPVGGPQFASLIGSLRSEGRAVLVGAAGGVPAADFGGALLGQFTKSLSVSVQSLDSVSPHLVAKAIAEIFDMVVQKKLRPAIDRTIPLSDLAQAHEAIAAGQTLGKVVVRPQS